MKAGFSSPSESVPDSGMLSTCYTSIKSFRPWLISAKCTLRMYVQYSQLAHQKPDAEFTRRGSIVKNPPCALTASAKHPASLPCRAPARASPSRPHLTPPLRWKPPLDLPTGFNNRPTRRQQGTRPTPGRNGKHRFKNLSNTKIAKLLCKERVEFVRPCKKCSRFHSSGFPRLVRHRAG